MRFKCYLVTVFQLFTFEKDFNYYINLKVRLKRRMVLPGLKEYIVFYLFKTGISFKLLRKSSYYNKL